MTDHDENDPLRRFARAVFSTDPDRPVAAPEQIDPTSDDAIARQLARELFAPTAEEPTR